MRGLIAASALVLFWWPAFADISGETIANYNKAVTEAASAEDIAEAAAALAGEAIASPEDDMSGLLAFEAAWTLCQIGQCDRGYEAAKFSAAQELKSPDAYPSAETRLVLERFISWKQEDSKTTREGLTAALSTLTEGDVSMVSLAAHQANYLHLTQRQEWNGAAQAAGAAALHMAPIKDEIFQEYALAELTRITSQFQSDKDIDTYGDILDLEEELFQRIQSEAEATPERKNETLSKIWHQTSAWEGAIESFFNSTGEESSTKRIFADRPRKERVVIPNPDYCEGRIVKPPQLTFPEEALRQGIIGSLIIGFTIDHGKPKDVEVLAAVPQGVFEKEAIRAMKKIRWEPKEGIDTSKCSMVQENYVYPLRFLIDN